MANENSRKVIGFSAAACIVIGSIIGSGIFLKPSTMAMQVTSPVWLIVVWVVAGIFSLFGALIYSEPGAMLPQTGGVYVYFRVMYGDFVAFLYGWAAFTVINTASVAAISFACAAYSNFFLHIPHFSAHVEKSVSWYIPYIGTLYPLANAGIKSLAMGIIIALTFLNYISVRASSAFQVVSTMLKLIIICLVVFGIFWSTNGTMEHFIQPSAHPKYSWSLIGGLVSALTGAFMAYDGWINITFMAGEIRNAQKNIPRSLISGVFVCVLVYVLVNLAYLYVLPIDKMAASSLVASDAIAAALGKTSEAIVAALIVLCTFGSINGNAMSTARVTYAMAKDHLFFSWAGKDHPRFKTPGNALWIHAVVACLFIISGSFDLLADIFTFVTWMAYLLGAIGIFILRKKMPDKPRPYKVWGYPYVPILFILFAAFYVVSTIWNDVYNYTNGLTPVVNSLLGILITAMGIPLYWYFKTKK
jgi:APA family basic amino acid/polyamine antiporter